MRNYASEINQASQALFDPASENAAGWRAQAQKAYSDAEQASLSKKEWARVQYAYAAFEMQLG